MFVKKYGTSGFNSFIYPEGVSPPLFSQLCVYHISDPSEGSGLGVSIKAVSQQFEQIKPQRQMTYLNKDQ